jgi:PTS hybrid protein
MRESAERNGHVSLVLVSHSSAIAFGIAELVTQMAGPDVTVRAVGGTCDGGLGTDGGAVLDALRQSASGVGGIVLTDIGSTVLAVRAALGELDARERARLLVADAPLLEGAIAAGVSSSTGASLEEVGRAAEEARHILKL